MITVLNGARDGWVGEYIGRVCYNRPRSPLNNPFRAKARSEEEHRVVVRKYRRWLWQRIEVRDPEILTELNRLRKLAEAGDLALICWCSPLPCHGDIVKACIEWMIEKDIVFDV